MKAILKIVQSIPYFSLERQYLTLEPEISDAVREVFSSGNFILGTQVRNFESAYAAYTGVSEAIGTGNGLDALVLALMALGIGPGDEVIVPSNTYFATWTAVSRVGAKPVPVEPDFLLIQSEQIQMAITDRTRAIIVVHLYGFVCEMEPIMRLAREAGIWVIEDNAQGHGATYQSKTTGSLGDLAATSFYPTKNLGAAGDGGMVTTQSTELAEKIRHLRNYGSPQRDVLSTIGLNSRLDELQAAILLRKLHHLPRWVQRRQEIAAQYYGELQGVGDLQCYFQTATTSPSFHVFPVYTQHRNSLAKYLASIGIGTLVHYPTPPYLQPVYQQQYEGLSFPVADNQASTQLSLPIWPELTDSEIERVCSAIKEFFNHHLKAMM